ncbi:MAG: phasin family protein [Rhodoferax sp.]|uniref:phasin family protein n=1 Tax=Rhodoferax sp. TaxID=50421 RepID=UPI00301B3050
MNTTPAMAETKIVPKKRTRRAVSPVAVAAKTATSNTIATKSRARKTVAKAQTAVVPKTTTLKQVATQSRRKVSTVVHLTRDASFKLIDTQRTIWLAGLGALAKVTTTTGTKGERAFEALVEAGEKMESQARGAINNNADLLKARIDDATRVVDQGIDSVGDAFDARIKKALARLGYPKTGKGKK